MTDIIDPLEPARRFPPRRCDALGLNRVGECNSEVFAAASIRVGAWKIARLSAMLVPCFPGVPRGHVYSADHTRAPDDVPCPRKKYEILRS